MRTQRSLRLCLYLALTLLCSAEQQQQQPSSNYLTTASQSNEPALQPAIVYEAAMPKQQPPPQQQQVYEESTTAAAAAAAGASKKVIGSSVHSSVAVVLDGNEPQFTDAVGHKVPKPQPSLQVASPIDLLNPDRYEFYTFDEHGELIKRLMTMQEIQSIVANGDGEGPSIIHNAPLPQAAPEKNVQDIVQSVQSVLNKQVAANSSNIELLPVLDTPDVSSSWSLILPAIFGNTGGDIFPQQRPQQIVMTPESELLESSTTPRATKKPKPAKRKPGNKRKTTSSPSTQMTPQQVQEELDPMESVYTGMQQYQQAAAHLHDFDVAQIQPIYQKLPSSSTAKPETTTRRIQQQAAVSSSVKKPGNVQRKPTQPQRVKKPSSSNSHITNITATGNKHKQKKKPTAAPATTTTTTTAIPTTVSTTTTTAAPVITVELATATTSAPTATTHKKRKRKPTRTPGQSSSSSSSTSTTSQKPTKSKRKPTGKPKVPATQQQQQQQSTQKPARPHRPHKKPRPTKLTATAAPTTAATTTTTTAAPASTSEATTAAAVEVAATVEESHVIEHDPPTAHHTTTTTAAPEPSSTTTTTTTTAAPTTSTTTTTTAAPATTTTTTKAPTRRPALHHTKVHAANKHHQQQQQQQQQHGKPVHSNIAETAVQHTLLHTQNYGMVNTLATTTSSTTTTSTTHAPVYPVPAYDTEATENQASFVAAEAPESPYKQSALPSLAQLQQQLQASSTTPAATAQLTVDQLHSMDQIVQSLTQQLLSSDKPKEPVKYDSADSQEQMETLAAKKKIALSTTTTTTTTTAKTTTTTAAPLMSTTKPLLANYGGSTLATMLDDDEDTSVSNEATESTDKQTQMETTLSSMELSPEQPTPVVLITARPQYFTTHTATPPAAAATAAAATTAMEPETTELPAHMTTPMAAYEETETEADLSATSKPDAADEEAQHVVKFEPLYAELAEPLVTDITELPTTEQQQQQQETTELAPRLPVSESSTTLADDDDDSTEVTPMIANLVQQLNLEVLKPTDQILMSNFQEQAATVASTLVDGSNTLVSEIYMNSNETKDELEFLMSDVIQQITQDAQPDDSQRLSGYAQLNATFLMPAAKPAASMEPEISATTAAPEMTTIIPSNEELIKQETAYLSTQTTTEATTTTTTAAAELESTTTALPVLSLSQIYAQQQQQEDDEQQLFELQQLETGSKQEVKQPAAAVTTTTATETSSEQQSWEQSTETTLTSEETTASSSQEQQQPELLTNAYNEQMQTTAAQEQQQTEKSAEQTQNVEDSATNAAQLQPQYAATAAAAAAEDATAEQQQQQTTTDSVELTSDVSESDMSYSTEQQTEKLELSTVKTLALNEETVEEISDELTATLTDEQATAEQQEETTSAQKFELHAEEDAYVKLGETTASVVRPQQQPQLSYGQQPIEQADEEDEDDQASYAPSSSSTAATTTTTTATPTTKRLHTLKPVSYYVQPTLFGGYNQLTLDSNKPLTYTANSNTQQRPVQRPAALSNLMAAATQATRPPVKLEPSPLSSQGLEASTLRLDEDVLGFARLCNELAFSYWRAITSEKISSARSLVISPFALTSMLSMMFLGARGSTSGEMNEVLKLDDMVSFNPHLILRNITNAVEQASDADIATAAFVREIFSDRSNGKILPFFKEKTQQFYGGHVEEVNFHVVNDIVRRRTNLLVKRHTMGKVLEYLRTNSVWVNGPLATVSANLYQTDCSRGSTNERDGEMFFQVNPTVRQRRLVPIPAVLYRTGFTAGYEPQLDATIVAFGRIQDTVSTIYVMPGHQSSVAPTDNLDRLERQLMEQAFGQSQLWSKLLTALMERPGMEVQLPRFSHRSFVNATLGLQKLGLKGLFQSDFADLRGLTGAGNRDIYLSDMIQINTFSTCGESKISDHHHVEMYPAPPLRKRNKDVEAHDEDEYDSSEAIVDFGSLVQESSLGRGFYDDLLDPKYLELPLPLRPRQARVPDAPRLRFDKPFLYFVRHNPTGMLLFMGRFNPRLLP